MKPEKRILFDDVMDQSRREATLFAGGKILRRRRFKRIAGRSFALLAVAALAIVAVYPKHTAVVKMAVTKPVVHLMTDKELLALFPNVPVGLMKLPDGREKLIFLRPGDEQKYIVHL